MINVNIGTGNLEKILKDGYTLEMNNNVLTIRNRVNKPIVEIIYFEETHDILISTEKEFVWCNKIVNIDSCTTTRPKTLRIYYEEVHKKIRATHYGIVIAENL